MNRTALLLPALLAACAGYTPLYAPASAAGNLAERVEVGTVEMAYIREENVGERRVAQAVSQRLRQDFPHAGTDKDVLAISITEEAAALALRRTALVEREQLSLTAHITLTDPQGAVLYTGGVGSSAAYNVETTPYSTESGKNFARQSAAENLAEEIIRRLALYYHQHPKTPPLAP
ncbi:MAG: hypothetical protein H6922_05525 [Pseudomonadaceae bacterium]|nr:hypothetical protein [Pseudomonadaceae bacterium]